MVNIEAFKKKYGDKEVKLEKAPMTIYDNYPSAYSSGSNGYITKVRVRNNTLEFYHDWWAYGWFSYSDMYKDYPKAVNDAIEQLNL